MSTCFLLKYIIACITKYFYFTQANKAEIYKTLVEFIKRDTYKIVNIPIYTYQTLSNKIKKFLKGYQKPIYFNASLLPQFDITDYSPTQVFNMEIEKEFLENNAERSRERQDFINKVKKPESILLNPYLYGLLYNSCYKYTTDHKVLKYLSSHLQNYNSYLYYNSHSGIYEICGELANMNFNISNYDLPKFNLIDEILF
jgi:hypothetical protein